MFAYKTENRLDFADIKEEDIYIIIKYLPMTHHFFQLLKKTSFLKIT